MRPPPPSARPEEVLIVEPSYSGEKADEHVAEFWRQVDENKNFVVLAISIDGDQVDVFATRREAEGHLHAMGRGGFVVPKAIGIPDWGNRQDA